MARTKRSAKKAPMVGKAITPRIGKGREQEGNMKIGNKRATKMGRNENYFPRLVKQHPISKSGSPAKKKATKK